MADPLGGFGRDVRTLFGSGAVGGLTDDALLDRFVDRGDRAALAELVRRHGPMVRAVCRGVSRCPHDADDAAQATFLILTRRAGSLRRRAALGGWLHRVARRAAVQAAADAARRRTREERAAVPEAVSTPEGPGWDDTVPVLHEEIARLPEKYRAPLILCELEALTRDQAAGRLGWPAGTVAGRLARARDLLRTRLLRRGVGPATLAVALAAARDATAEAAGLVDLFEGNASQRTAESLAARVGRSLARSPLKRLATVALTAGLALTALAASLGGARDTAVSPAGPRDEPETRASVPVTGVIVDTDGRPAAGVSVYSSYRDGDGWGKVVDEVKTDAEGRFRLAAERDLALPAPRPGAVWAYKPGRLLASYSVQRGNVHPDVPLRLALGPATGTVVEVRDPQGLPVAGATIMPRVLNREYLDIPGRLAERIGADTETDANGRAHITALLREEIGTVFVTARGYGTQQFGFGHGSAQIRTGPKVVHLMRVGRVEGLVVGAPDQVRGLKLKAMVWNTQSDPPPPPALGLFDVATDPDGRFVIAEAPEGRLSFWGETETGRHSVTSPRDLRVEPGLTTRVELPLSPGVRLHGVVREKGTGKPVPGAVMGTLRSANRARTDADGRYALFTVPGRPAPMLWSTPRGYAAPMYGLHDATIPEGSTEFELPAVELSRAGDVTGRVVDAAGGPVAGARVAASWPVDEGPNRRGRREATVTTDSLGAFTVADVPLGAPVKLTAEAASVGKTAQPVVANHDNPAELTLAPAAFTGMSGRVVDQRGKPVAGARVHLRRQEREDNGFPTGDVPVDLAGVPVLIANADGRFETPLGLDPKAEYAAFAEADGLGPGQTPWTRASARSFPDVVLGPAGTAPPAALEGIVRDPQGQPLPGATVWATYPGGPVNRVRVSTDAKGGFVLEGVPAAGATLHVEVEGYEPHQVDARPENSPLRITLTPAGGPRP